MKRLYPIQRAIASLAAASRQCTNRGIGRWWPRDPAGHGPALSQVKHASQSASTWTGTGASGAAAPQGIGQAIPYANRAPDHSSAHRVQQQWDAALAHAVGPEAVAGGDAALRELLQVRRGTPAERPSVV